MELFVSLWLDHGNLDLVPVMESYNHNTSGKKDFTAIIPYVHVHVLRNIMVLYLCVIKNSLISGTNIVLGLLYHSS